MASYVETKIWRELTISDPVEFWVLRKLLRASTGIIDYANPRETIYRIYHGLGPSNNPYLTKYNAARGDLIVQLIPYPDKVDERIIPIEHEPSDDISYWLATHVLGYSDDELKALCSPFDPDDIRRELIPLIKLTYRRLRVVKLKDPYLQNFHRARHLMIRYYLDAVYHEISS